MGVRAIDNAAVLLNAHYEIRLMEKAWLALLQSKKRLDRERGLQHLQLLVDENKLTDDERKKSEEDVLQLVTSLLSSWETKHGGLMAASVLIPKASDEFLGKLKGDIPILLEYDESRVRLAAGIDTYLSPSHNTV